MRTKRCTPKQVFATLETPKVGFFTPLLLTKSCMKYKYKCTGNWCKQFYSTQNKKLQKKIFILYRL